MIQLFYDHNGESHCEEFPNQQALEARRIELATMHDINIGATAFTINYTSNVSEPYEPNPVEVPEVTLLRKLIRHQYPNLDEIPEAARQTTHHTSHRIITVGIGRDHTATITIDDESLAVLMLCGVYA